MHKRAFIDVKFDQLLSATVFTTLLAYIPDTIDNFIAGNAIGEQTLAAIDVVSPLMMLPFMIYLLFVPGLIRDYSYEMGETDISRTGQSFSLSAEMAVFSGVISAVIALAVKTPYMMLMGVQGEMLKSAGAYYNCMIGYVLLQPLCFFSNDIMITEGKEKAAERNSLLQLGANIILALLLVKPLGIVGIGLATVSASLIVPVFAYFFYLRKAASEKFSFYCSRTDIRNACQYGLVDFSITLIYSVTQYLISSYILHQFGPDALIVWAVLLCLYDFYGLLSGFAEALKPLQNIYEGEKNEKGLRVLMKHTVSRAALISVIFSVVILLVSPFLPGWFGVDSVALANACVRGCRYMAAATFSYAVVDLFSSYYINHGYYLISSAGNAILYTVSFLIGPIAMSCMIGSEGIYLGFAVGILISPLLYAGLIVLKSGRSGFPLYLTTDVNNDILTSCILSKESVAETSAAIREDLERKSVDPKTTNMIELIIEEVCMTILEENPGRKIYMEYSVLFRDMIHLIIKDTGKIDDLTNEDRHIDDFRSYFLSSLMHAQKQKIYLITGGYNRSVYCFPLTLTQKIQNETGQKV